MKTKKQVKFTGRLPNALVAQHAGVSTRTVSRVLYKNTYTHTRAGRAVLEADRKLRNKLKEI
ncbi:MAG TPA: LacI family DNA-binding transcriptional regulator [Bacteroidales bacterium]|nr:LacI family DNA-binding transcriptional regulator [Bacteroidales bacterium]